MKNNRFYSQQNNIIGKLTLLAVIDQEIQLWTVHCDTDMHQRPYTVCFRSTLSSQYPKRNRSRLPSSLILCPDYDEYLLTKYLLVAFTMTGIICRLYFAFQLQYNCAFDSYNEKKRHSWRKWRKMVNKRGAMFNSFFIYFSIKNYKLASEIHDNRQYNTIRSVIFFFFIFLIWQSKCCHY